MITARTVQDQLNISRSAAGPLKYDGTSYGTESWIELTIYGGRGVK